MAKIKILEEGIQSVKNWHVNWRERFRSANLGQSLIVLPPWETSIELSGSHSGMWIDSGQGFGTGNHLSTALVLEMLEQYLLDADTFPESMIDLGIG